MKDRTYVVMLNKIYGIGREKRFGARTLSGVFVTKNRCTSVIDAGGDFFTYHRMEPESCFDIYLDGQWYDKDSEEAEEIMARHWREDNL